jgi:hypothetical protein
MKSRSYYLIAVILPCALPGLARAAAPSGWTIAGSAPTHYVFALEASSPVKQSKSALIAAKPGATRNGFGTLMQMISAGNYRGSRVMFSGDLRTQRAGRAQMWMRVDGAYHQVLAFDNMSSRPIKGTTRWKRYDVVLNVPKNSVAIAFGFLLGGPGKVWAADFRLKKVGDAVPTTSTAPVLHRTPRNLNFEQ